MTGFLNPQTFSAALEIIQNWDRQAGNLPLLSEQIATMLDGPQSWSTTHNWPAVRNTMQSAGLIVNLPHENVDGWRVPMTEITELGREVRSHFQKINLEKSGLQSDDTTGPTFAR